MELPVAKVHSWSSSRCRPWTLNAKVDGAGSGQYAELDELGRYKVILPFDLSGRKDGKASAWLRMMQPLRQVRAMAR